VDKSPNFSYKKKMQQKEADEKLNNRYRLSYRLSSDVNCAVARGGEPTISVIWFSGDLTREVEARN
jgi:hypothetical protein